MEIAEHALNDPVRYKTMSRAWKALNPLNPKWLQQWNRIPLWIKSALFASFYAEGGILSRCEK
jgi:hypothetical protein